MATKKIKEYTRDEAEALARQGRRVRQRHWEGRQNVLTFKNGKCQDGHGNPYSWEHCAIHPKGWRLLAPTRAELRAELAAVRAEYGKAYAEHQDLVRQLKGAAHDLRAQLADAKANAVPFKKGDRVVYESGKAPGTIVSWHAVYKLRDAAGDVRIGYTIGDLTLVDEAKPAEPVWTPCSAAEAREKHAAGMRVQHKFNWSLGEWLHRGRWSGHEQPTSCAFGKVDRSIGGLMQLVSSQEASGWRWSDPLPEGGAGV